MTVRQSRTSNLQHQPIHDLGDGVTGLIGRQRAAEDRAGQYDVCPDAVAGRGVGAGLVVTQTIDLAVATDASAVTSQLASELNALKAAATTRNDQKAVDDAIAQLAAIAPAGDPLANVQRLLAIIADLQSITLDSAAASSDADRLTVYWQSRIGA